MKETKINLGRCLCRLLGRPDRGFNDIVRTLFPPDLTIIDPNSGFTIDHFEVIKFYG